MKAQLSGTVIGGLSFIVFLAIVVIILAARALSTYAAAWFDSLGVALWVVLLVGCACIGGFVLGLIDAKIKERKNR